MLYSILIYSAEGLIDQLDDEAKEALLDSHRSLQQALTKDGGFVATQLTHSQSAMTLHAPSNDRPKTLMVDGPFSESKEQFVGFYLVNCKDIQTVRQHAERILTPYTSLEIRPVEWMGGKLDAAE